MSRHLDYAENFITFRNIESVFSVVLIVILIAVSLFIMTNTIKSWPRSAGVKRLPS